MYIFSMTAGIRDSIFAAFDRSAKAHAGNIALKARGGRGHHYSYREVSDLALGLASGLTGRFDSVPRVGLLSENRPEWPITYLAAMASGKTVVPIDAGLKPNEIAYIVNHAGLQVVFASGKFESMLRGLTGGLQVVSFEENSPDSWRNLLSEPIESPASGERAEAALIYTSGTTGTPKAVVLTHRNLLGNLEGIGQAIVFDEDDVFLSVLPLHHTFEATCGFLAPLMSGSTVVYARSFKSRELLEDIAFNRVTVMCGVPLLFEKMSHAIRRGVREAAPVRRAVFHAGYAVSSVGWKLRLKLGRPLLQAARTKAGLNTIRMFVSGGAALPAETARFFNYLGIFLLQGYGMTECSPVVSVNTPKDVEFGSVGRPLGNLDVAIDNPGPDGIGEILIRGISTTPGYLDNPGATRELFKGDWLRTGDLGHLSRKHLWITGRAKSIIVSAAGKNIYPEELEEKLQVSLYVAETVVVGRKRNGRAGEEVCAIVVPDLEQYRVDFGMSPEAPDMAKIREVLQDVVNEVNREVADYKRISSLEIQLEELEKTSTKKVKRFKYH